MRELKKTSANASLKLVKPFFTRLTSYQGQTLKRLTKEIAFDIIAGHILFSELMMGDILINHHYIVPNP